MGFFDRVAIGSDDPDRSELTLLLRGARSDFLSAQTAEEMVRRNPRITCQAIEGASHYVHDDNFEDFQGAVDTFLDTADLGAWTVGSRA